MLAGIKRRVTGWVAYLIIGIIAIPFALFGIHQYINANHNVTVALVDGEKITSFEYLSQLESSRREAQERLGENYSESIERALRENTLNSLINNKVLANVAKTLNLATLESELVADVVNNPMFFKDDKFDIETYRQVLQLNGISLNEYEARLLEAKTNTQLLDNLADSQFLSSYETKLITDLLNEQRNIDYSEINIDNFANDIDISEQKIAAYYEENKDRLINPEQIKIKMVELTKQDLINKIEPNEEEVRVLYELEKSVWQTDEERKASHILVEDEALANELRAKIINGEDFAQLAAEYSIDSASAKEGGSLGFFTKGVMVPQFEESVFNMNIGEISDIVASDFGYHIIKLEEIKEAQTKQLAEVETEVIELYKNNKAEEQFFILSEDLQNAVYERGLAAANEFDLTTKVSNFFSQNSKDYDQKIVTAAFSLKNQNNNEIVVVEVDDNHLTIIQKEDFIAQNTQTIEQATPNIKQSLIVEEATAKAISHVNALINNKTNLNNSLGWIYRDTLTGEIARLANFAFSMNKNKEYDFFVDNDKIIVVKINDIRVNTERDFDTSLVDNYYSQELFNDILKYIKSKTDIEVFHNYL